MTNEERHRTMEFILEQQAHFAAHLQQLEEERIRDRPRLARLEESFQRLVQLAEISDSRLDRLESTSSALEATAAAHDELLHRVIHLEEITQSRLERLEFRSHRDDSL